MKIYRKFNFDSLAIVLLLSFAGPLAWAQEFNIENISVLSTQLNFSESKDGIVTVGNRAVNQTLQQVKADIIDKKISIALKIDEQEANKFFFTIVDNNNFVFYRFKRSEIVSKADETLLTVGYEAPQLKKIATGRVVFRVCLNSDSNFIQLSSCSPKFLLKNSKIVSVYENAKENKFYINEAEVGTNGSLFVDDEKSFVNLMIDLKTGGRVYIEFSKPELIKEVKGENIYLRINEKKLSFANNKNVKSVNLGSTKNITNKKINIKLFESSGFEFQQKVAFTDID
jgi:hypothetical protein